MKAVRDVLAALFFAVLTLAPASSQAADSADPVQVQNAVRDAVRSLKLQTDFPSGQTMKTENRIDPQRRSFDLSWLNFLSDFAVIILWTAVFIIVTVIAVVVYNNLRSSRRFRGPDHAKQAGDDALATVAVRMDKAQGEADELASRGSFAEAMHVLLLQSVTELRRRLDVSIAASLTSREILHRIGLFPEGRAMFADIIHRVEISYFGAYQPDQEDYLACRHSFKKLTELLRKGSAT